MGERSHPQHSLPSFLISPSHLSHTHITAPPPSPHLSGNNDIITMKADDDGDKLTLMFENEKQDRISDFDLKLMSIESEHLGIPEQTYSAEVVLPSSQYQGIVRDLATIGDTVQLSVTKEGIKFTSSGDIGTANVTLRWVIMTLG